MSDPPLDSVCPCCGSFSWITITEKTKPLLSQKDYATLIVLMDNMRQCKSKAEISQLLVDGISLMLSVEAVSLSLVDRNDPEHRLCLFAHRGPSAVGHVEETALSDVESKRPALTSQNEKSGVSLLPFYRHDHSLAGFIAVKQSSKIPDSHLEEQNRAIASLAAVAVGTHLLD
ncbi:hypothetical protein SH501x_001635 [Pirellulaceae bacterium SH501]